MIGKIKRYMQYVHKFSRSKNKSRLLIDVKKQAKEHGYIIGLKKILHEKNNQIDNVKYKKWLFNIHLPDFDTLSKQSEYVFDYMPLISIVTPTFNTPKQFLIEMIESVISQSYTNWELCIADGASNDQNTLRVLKEYESRYHNIKVVYLSENYHISGNTNEALKLVSGDYISFFDHDDLLTPNCLFEYVKKINEDSKPALLYCDEDKVDSESKLFFNPVLKPKFSLDKIRSDNYICHLMTIRKDLLDKIGELDTNCNGAQDYDLVLRLIDIEPKVSHVSKILYHWRVHENSTAKVGGASKPYTHAAGKIALEKHLKRNGIVAKVVDGVSDNMYKIKY